MKKRGDFLVGAFFFLFCLVIFIGSFFLRSLTKVSIGPEFLPRVLSILGMIVSALLIYSTVKNKPKNVVEKDDSSTTSKNDIQTASVEKSEPTALSFSPETLKVFLLMLMYALLVQPLGYLLTTTGYLILHFLLVSNKEQKKIIAFVVISVAFSVLSYYTFRNFFGVLLPTGILG